MAHASIPVDLFNPGQVFACLGFLEAADVLLGDAEGGFDWSDETDVKFLLHANGKSNPFERVLDFLATTEIERWGPIGYTEQKKQGKTDDEDSDDEEGQLGESLPLSETFPAAEGGVMELPIRLRNDNIIPIDLGHWADGSSRSTFKLYSGNRSAFGIAHAMLLGTREKPKKNQVIGDIKTKGILQLWGEQHDAMLQRPFDILTPMRGSFNFDPRGAWTANDVGYSLNDLDHQVIASPVVELLAAWGLENTRPYEDGTRKVLFSSWGGLLPPVIARIAIFGGIPSLPQKRFHFQLAMSGKNKVVTFAEQEI